MYYDLLLYFINTLYFLEHKTEKENKKKDLSVGIQLVVVSL